MNPLNSPLEIGLRTVILLTEVFPKSLDIDRLVLMDYCLLHSEDFDGPNSVQPAVSTRSGELGIKRTVLEHGVQLMMRAGMVEVEASTHGITYRASEAASPFLRLVRSPMLDQLCHVARWVGVEFSGLTNDAIRERMRMIASQWSEEWNEGPTDGVVGEVLVWADEESSL
ncbi:ABC-three component system middle component 2 [Glutamicibacter sp. 287]|uniref:ABC-three component system middle component 2 n=1 Tax=unclassified Glutamicibacter TaxID=2627139 RepID=UPI0040340426